MIIGDPIRTVAPTALPVSLSEFKAHERILSDEEDAYLAGLLRVATEYAEQYTGLSLITSTWTQTFSAFAETNPTRNAPLILRRRPLQAVLSVEYLADTTTSATLDPTSYRVLRIGSDMTPGAIALVYGGSWPTTFTDDEAITVTYRAGFGDDHNAVPEMIRHAIQMAAGTWYGFREDVIMGSTLAELPSTSRALLREWRPLGVA